MVMDGGVEQVTNKSRSGPTKCWWPGTDKEAIEFEGWLCLGVMSYRGQLVTEITTNSWTPVHSVSVRRRCGCPWCERDYAEVTIVSPRFPDWVVKLSYDEDANPIGCVISLQDDLVALSDRHPVLSRRQNPLLQFGAYVDFGRVWLRELTAHPGASSTKTFWQDAFAFGRRQPNRKRGPDSDYVVIAQAYILSTREGRSKREVAERFGLTESQLNNKLTTARDKGLLNRPGRGSTNNQLTAKGLAVLGELQMGQG